MPEIHIQNGPFDHHNSFNFANLYFFHSCITNSKYLFHKTNNLCPISWITNSISTLPFMKLNIKHASYSVHPKFYVLLSEFLRYRFHCYPIRQASEVQYMPRKQNNINSTIAVKELTLFRYSIFELKCYSLSFFHNSFILIFRQD